MSQTLIEATALLCRLLEITNQHIAGPLITASEHQDALKQLRREHLIGFGQPLNWLICPECGNHMARVVRELPTEKVLLLCGGDCEDFEAPRSVCQTTTLQLDRIVGYLTMGMGLNRLQVQRILPEQIWRLGLVEVRRGKPVTWYFARHLHNIATATHLLSYLSDHRADRSARILTSSVMPLPVGSPLNAYDVIHLADVSRLSLNRFEFFEDRVNEPSEQYINDMDLVEGTTLRYVRTKKKAYIDGTAYPLEAMQATLLLALMDDYDHRMESHALRDACRSTAINFKPVKLFERNKQVYATFIRYLAGDQEYELIIPTDDLQWLSGRSKAIP